MSNETFASGLLREHTPDPLEGHTVVVFERMGEAGEKFHRVLPPGTPLARRGLIDTVLRPRVEYFAYAVDASPELHLDFSEHVVTDDHAHDFDLLFTLCYSVEDPRLLASSRKSDPLGKVRAKVGRTLAAGIAQLRWDEVWNSFRTAADTVVHDHLRALRTFAAQYGIAIRAVELELQLPGDETRIHRDTTREMADARRKADLELAELAERERITRERREIASRHKGHEHEHTVRGAELEDDALTVELRRKVRRDHAAAVSQGWANIGAQITSPEELREAMRTTGRSAGEVAGGERAASDQLGGGDTSAPHAALQGGLGAIVSELLAATRAIQSNSSRNALRGAILHLVSEVLSDAACDARREEQYARGARALLDGLNPRPGTDELDRLHQLIEPERLRGTLYP